MFHETGLKPYPGLKRHFFKTRTFLFWNGWNLSCLGNDQNFEHQEDAGIYMVQLSIILHTLTRQRLPSFGSSIACQKRLQCRFALLGNKIDYRVEPKHCDIRRTYLFTSSTSPTPSKSTSSTSSTASTSSTSSTSLHDLHHLHHIRLDIIYIIYIISSPTSRLLRSTYSGVLAHEYFFRSHYSGVVTQELILKG